LLLPRQSLALWFRAERRATRYENRAEQRDHQRESDSSP